MAATFEIFFEKLSYIVLKHPGIETFDEITLSVTVKETEAILCFATFHKNLKI